MAIKARVLVVGGKTFHSEPEAKRVSVNKPPQDRVKTTEPENRPPPVRTEHEAPQDQVEIFDEPKLVSVRNGFILQSNSKFHRDMKE
jgi:hypothetical protein